MRTEKPSGNIYYIGAKQSDIASSFNYETDKFFAGSVTIFGDDEKTAYNARNKIQLNVEDAGLVDRNEKYFGDHIAKVCTEIIRKDPSALFMPYSVQYASKVPKEFQDRIICANDPMVLAFLNSKFNFKRLMNGRVPQADFRFMTGAQILQLVDSGEIPHKKEVVAQTEFGAGGKGTFILTKKNLGSSDIVKKINPSENYVVSDFVNNIASASFRIMVSDNEVAMYPPSIQTMKGPTFIGSDPFSFSELDKKHDGAVSAEVKKVAQTIGHMFQDIDKYVDLSGVKNKKLRGCLGVDFIITETPPYVCVIETNPRFTGASGLDNILSHEAGAGSVFEHCYQAFYQPETKLAKNIEGIMPFGQSIYAEEGQAHNHAESEGYDKVPKSRHEEGAYTYRRYIQKQAGDHNTFEAERLHYKEYMHKEFGASRFRIKELANKLKTGVASFVKLKNKDDNTKR